MFPTHQLYRILVAGASLAGLSHTSDAAILNVPTGFPTIQGAINAAVDGDEVVVANGTYNTDVDILFKSITLRSATNQPAMCIINCTAATGVTIMGAGEHVVVRGFQIRNGLRGIEVNADASASIENCVIPSVVCFSTARPSPSRTPWFAITPRPTPVRAC